jgi:hypothetical protein
MEYVRAFPKTARVPEGDAIPPRGGGPDDQEGVHPQPRLAGISGPDSEGGCRAGGNHPGSPFPDGGGRKADAEYYPGETCRGDGHRRRATSLIESQDPAERLSINIISNIILPARRSLYNATQAVRLVALYLRFRTVAVPQSPLRLGFFISISPLFLPYLFQVAFIRREGGYGLKRLRFFMRRDDYHHLTATSL